LKSARTTASAQAVAGELDPIGVVHDPVEHGVGKGLMPLPRLLALKRAQANVRGARATNQASIASDEESIGETRLQLLTRASNGRSRSPRS
jgi:hypothetical protein